MYKRSPFSFRLPKSTEKNALGRREKKSDAGGTLSSASLTTPIVNTGVGVVVTRNAQAVVRRLRDVHEIQDTSHFRCTSLKANVTFSSRTQFSYTRL